MSTLVSEIAAQAFREGNFVAVGETLTDDELAEAVPRLRNLISSLFGTDLGEQCRDWLVPAKYMPTSPLRDPLTPTGLNDSADSWLYPPANSRLIVNASATTTIYFPAYPNDGARMEYIDTGSSGVVTLDGNGRLIEGATTLVAAVSDPPDEEDVVLGGRKWLYRADLADWILINEALEEDDEVPLPVEFDDLLVTGLAIRLAPRFGVKSDEVTVARFTDMLDRLKKRYKQTERMPANYELRQTFSEL